MKVEIKPQSSILSNIRNDLIVMLIAFSVTALGIYWAVVDPVLNKKIFCHLTPECWPVVFKGIIFLPLGVVIHAMARISQKKQMIAVMRSRKRIIKSK